MSAINMERFDHYVVKILAKLYQEFPVDCVLEMSALAESPLEETVCWDTYRWLRDEGYIRQFDAFLGGTAIVVLSYKGLECLNAVPDSLQEDTSFGDQLVAAVNEGAYDAACGLVPKILEFGFRLMTSGG